MKSFTESNFNEKYCLECKLRDGKFAGTKPTNKSVNCPAGRQNNPMSIAATLNVIRNHGDVCSFNPAREFYGRAEIERMAAK